MGLFRMPSLGADMEAGTLTEWLIATGDRVARGDVVAVVETQKGAIEVECFEEGRVERLLAEPGRELPVGTPLALILAEGEVVPPPEAEPEAEPGTVAPAAAAPVPPPPRRGAVAASPAARRRAAELGLDLALLTGSGPGGVVVLADVERAAPAAQPQPAAEMHQAIAAAMTRSKREIPHFYLTQTLDIQPVQDWLAAHNATVPPERRLLLGALLLHAVALAAARAKVLNGRYENGRFQRADRVNPGLVVALRGGGLVVPALIGAETMTPEQTMAGMRDLVARARAGRLRSSEITGGTITVSALGDTGAEAMSAVIFPPQVAIVGIGAPQRRPWVVGDAVVPRQVVTLTVSADHRVADGRQVARFIEDIATELRSYEAP
ncbi:MAG: dihydrolipoamide acetyltransferase family protein [Pseudodonghicola sp.]